MEYAQTFWPRGSYLSRCAATFAAIFLMASACAAQVAPAGQAPESPWTQELKKHPELMAEFGQLTERLLKNLQFPPPWAESRLLPLLPESSTIYAAFPNYGDVAKQTLTIFRQELQQSSVLRDWWQHGELATTAPKVEDSLEKFSQLGQYLGEEIVVSATTEGREPSLLIVAQIRKPGLKNFLQQIVSELAGKSKPRVRVFDPQELAATKVGGSADELLILVRPDFVVAASDLATLRTFNTRLDRSSREFASTPFGQRVVQSYQGGATIVAAADLHQILKQVPPGSPESQKIFQRSGFADMKYLVWDHRNVAGQAVNEAELSFIAPRHGIASWLAKPAPLGSLDFVSPKPMLAGTVVLTNPAQIFDDVKELATASNPNAFAALAQFEQVLKLSLKDDLLSCLGGEITLELDSLNPPKPEWKAIFKVNDPSRLQQTLSTLLAAAHIEAEERNDGGITFYTFGIPSSQTKFEIGYAFVAGYLIIASGQDTVAEAVRLRSSGESLGKSRKLLASLPPGHSPEASASLYEDPIAMAAIQLRQVAPEMAESLSQLPRESAPEVISVYGEQTAIRETSTSGALDLGAVLVVAAIAIPNLLRSRVAANEASAVGAVRTVNTAQITYATVYPKRGFAPNLATLGIDPRGPSAGSEAHAGLVDDTLANESCTADAWCTKSGFHFRVTAVCKQLLCQEYVVVATPVDSNSGGRSFCSTSDAVIRSKTGPPLTSPVTALECLAWPPL
jgi:type II secretory pathway pseudopilin PulG